MEDMKGDYIIHKLDKKLDEPLKTSLNYKLVEEKKERNETIENLYN